MNLRPYRRVGLLRYKIPPNPHYRAHSVIPAQTGIQGRRGRSVATIPFLPTPISGGTPGAPGWSRIYRSLEHNQARQRMNQITGSSPQLRNFASTFQALQNHRHQADYDPNSRYLRSSVLNLIGQADASIQDLLSTSQDERRTLAVATILRPR